MGILYDQLFEQLYEKLSVMKNGINAAHVDQNYLVEVAASFPPTSVKPEHGTVRSKRAVALIAVAAGAAGLVYDNPLIDDACSVLSIFNLCTVNMDLGDIVDHVMATQKQFKVVLKRVQSENNEFFFALGNEIVETQEGGQKITEIVGVQLKLLEIESLEIKGVIAALSVPNTHLIQKVIFMQQIRDYVDHLEPCTHT